MRRIAALAVLPLLALTGCAEEREAPVHRLNAWEFPREQFIPRVPTRTPKAKARPHPAAVAPAPATAPPATGGDRVSEGAPSDAEIRAQLRELYGAAGGRTPARRARSR